MSNLPSRHDEYMRQALALARQGMGRTRPNPAVGAIVVKAGRVAGRGFHARAGEPHAEVLALQDAGKKAAGADLYVTLEPCCHQGRTGPCTEAVLAAGIRRIFVGIQDPNPLMQGRGLARLAQGGIEVACGLLEAECRELIAPFAKHLATGLPLVTLKAALTLDGFVATRSGESRWISSASSRARVHQLRNEVDAIAVGIGTVLADDPRLTARLPSGEGRNPVRVVFDSRLRLPPDAALLDAAARDGVHVFTSEPDGHPHAEVLRARGAQVHSVPGNAGTVDLSAACLELGRLGLQSLLLEGGGTLFGAFLRAGLVDRVLLFLAPLLFGGQDARPLFAGPAAATLAAAWRLQNVRSERLEDDLLVQAEVSDVHRID